MSLGNAASRICCRKTLQQRMAGNLLFPGLALAKRNLRVSLRKMNIAALLMAVLLAAPMTAQARDTGVKVLLDGQLWFCHVDPTGWPLADFKAVCAQIEPGGKGEVVEFIVDRKGKIRRKPAEVPKKISLADLRMRGALD
jgi:hypothetical protein